MQKPLHHRSKNPLSTTLNHIPMTRNQPVKLPRINPLHRLPERFPVPRGEDVPRKSLLPCRSGLVDSNGFTNLVRIPQSAASFMSEYCSLAGRLNRRSASMSVREGLCMNTSSRDPWPWMYSVSNSPSNSSEIFWGPVLLFSLVNM